MPHILWRSLHCIRHRKCHAGQGALPHPYPNTFWLRSELFNFFWLSLHCSQLSNVLCLKHCAHSRARCTLTTQRISYEMFMSRTNTSCLLSDIGKKKGKTCSQNKGASYMNTWNTCEPCSVPREPAKFLISPAHACVMCMIDFPSILNLVGIFYWSKSK